MQFYDESDGLKYMLEKRWIEKNGEFPKIGYNFVEKFRQIESFLNLNYHSEVVASAAAHGDGLLTDHGEDHINMVIDYIHKLLQCSNGELNGYEIFIILLAANFHDVGNIKGRDKHEQKIYDIMEEIGDNISLDIPAKRIVANIAIAHGGFRENDSESRDTLSDLNEVDFLNGKPIRSAMLAALLRFADELSDDNTRATKLKHDDIPKLNLIYHKYSKSLSPITFNGKTISFSFELSDCDVTDKIIKGDKEIYLYDEIINRLKKCLCELEYCRKYAEGIINISTLNIKITVTPKGKIKAIDGHTFSLRLAGYPNIGAMKIENYLSSDDSSKFISCGESLKRHLEDKFAVR
jgi:HD superfamily phosphodiesterase